MLISQVPASDRPRERLAREGAEALGERELLALVLSTGIRGKGAHEVAETLLYRFGSVGALSRATVAELSAIAGIGAAKASMRERSAAKASDLRLRAASMQALTTNR